MHTVTNLTLAAIQPRSSSLRAYSQMLAASCDRNPPPFGEAWYGDRYRAVSRDPDWMIQSLIANAAKEAEGSRKLWRLAGRAQQQEIATKVRYHAIDESRHAQLYLRLLDFAFPDATDIAFRSELDSLLPGYRSGDMPQRLEPEADSEVIDELIQMNIGEIRTRIHQLLLMPVIDVHAPPPARQKIRRILQSILNDETRHISYTAEVIEAAASRENGALLQRVMTQRLGEFNEITLQEVGAPSFE